MDPATVLMERATAEWIAFMASLPHLALEGLFGLLLLVACAVVMTLLAPPREYSDAGPWRVVGGTMAVEAPAASPTIGDAVAIRTHGLAVRAGDPRGSFSAHAGAAHVAWRGPGGSAHAARPVMRRHRAHRRVEAERADRLTSLAMRRPERARSAVRTTRLVERG